MGLHMLKPSLGHLKSPLRYIEQRGEQQVVARLTGNTLRAVRRRLLARSGALCECPVCIAGYPLKLTWKTMEVDHITPLYLGGTHEWNNMRALHVDCHARVTAEQQAERTLTGRVLVDDTVPWAAKGPGPRVRGDDDEMHC